MVQARDLGKASSTDSVKSRSSMKSTSSMKKAARVQSRRAYSDVDDDEDDEFVRGHIKRSVSAWATSSAPAELQNYHHHHRRYHSDPQYPECIKAVTVPAVSAAANEELGDFLSDMSDQELEDVKEDSEQNWFKDDIFEG